MTQWHSEGREETQRYLRVSPPAPERLQNPAGQGRIYYAALRRLAQQPAEGDDGGHAGTVEEEEGGHTLKAAGVSVVRQVVGQLPLDVQKQASEPPENKYRKTLVRCADEHSSVFNQRLCGPVWITRSSGVGLHPGPVTRLTQDTHTHQLLQM